VPIVTCEQGRDLAYDGAIAGSGQRLPELELPPKHGLLLESVHQFLRGKHPRLGIRNDDSQPACLDLTDSLGWVAVAVDTAALRRLSVDLGERQRDLLLHLPPFVVTRDIRVIAQQCKQQRRHTCAMSRDQRDLTNRWRRLRRPGSLQLLRRLNQTVDVGLHIGAGRLDRSGLE
jgi:hypothetical protein